MKMLNVCFVGYGSIAKRHIKNLISICKVKNIKLNIDLLRHDYACNDSIKSIRNIYYKNLPTSIKYDVIFITNPTSKHYQVIKDNNDKTKMFFVEKPLVSYEYVNRVKSLRINPNKIYVACPLRYKKTIQYIKNHVDNRNILCARVICSSYLPNWRQGINYKNTYSARNELGGGVRLDLIHEIDYIRFLFGDPLNIKSNYGKYSSLSINTEDLAVYILNYKDKIVELHLDYFGRVSQRKIELYTNDDVISVDLLKDIIKFNKMNRSLKIKDIKDNFYKAEMLYFLNIYYKKTKNINNLINALETIKLSKGV